MDVNGASTGSRNSSDSSRTGPKRKHTFVSRCTELYESKYWKPPALRAPVLLFTIAISWSLLAVLQFLLIKSQRNDGIIFAPKINELALGKTFLYLYFPTIIAVLFSIFWAWIDLETKRMEPYYQLSKENGALGKDSLLLHYPFDFIPLVPLKAFRDRHWPVFWASFAVVLVTWGLVPIQAGIFSTQTITRNITQPFERSSGFIPASQQPSELTLRFAQSTYGIAVLNETLAQYMARNYTLAPIRPTAGDESNSSPGGNWTAPTTMYSLDLWCEPAVLSQRPLPLGGLIANSSNGCAFTMGLTGNITIGENSQSNRPIFDAREFTAMYAGYSNPRGFADYALVGECPAASNSTFYAAMARNKAREEDPPNNVTAIFCWPTFYQQDVVATVDSRTLIPSKVDIVGPKQPLAQNLFNTSQFEDLLSSGSFGVIAKADVLPATKSVPDYMEYIAQTNVSLTSGPVGGGRTQPMVGLSLAVGNRSLEDYLDWKVLAQTYAAAYRLTFARAMRDVLDVDFRTIETVTGYTRHTTEAVVLEPVFVYVVEALLGIVSLATIALLYLSCTRKRNLAWNPSTIAAVMAMVADNQPLLADIEGYDCCTMEEIRKHVGDKRYKLIHDGSGSGLIEINGTPQLHGNHGNIPPMSQRQHTPSDIAKPVRPREFTAWMAVPFVSLFIALAIALAFIFAKARILGLPLPSKNSIVQNVLENYIPTAIATLIEPMWVLINRLLCMLQPIEELQKCNAPAKKSIDLDYSSLPPQLVVLQALRSKHFVLAAVCTMALLANLLAVSFAGIFNQATIDIQHTTTFNPPYNLKFVPINGSIGPVSGDSFGSMESSGAYQGGNGENHVLIADSYFRQGTPLPAWTDETMFYLPIAVDRLSAGVVDRFEAKTRAFGAKLECTSLAFDNNFQASLKKLFAQDGTNHPSINITLPGSGVQCTKLGTFMSRGPVDSETETCVKGPAAAELVLTLVAKPNATQVEVDACMGSVVLGWLRDRNGTCEAVPDVKLNEQNSAFVTCRPKLVTGTATIKVDASGRLQEKVMDLSLEDALGSEHQDLFADGPAGLVGQSNKYLFKKDSAAWHNDSFADDFTNYFIRRVSNSSRLLDPTKGLPSFSDIEGPLTKSYSLLFAIWMGTNKDKLLVPYEAGSLPAMQGWRVVPERRLFVSMPMFIISEVILCTYVLVAIMVYVRRPGQYLPRMPTSIASVIALFAASAAVMDMQNTSHLDRKGRARHLEKVDARYGYGSFIGGGDGRVHIGIEKTPFVRVRSRTTWLEKKVSSFRKGSAG